MIISNSKHFIYIHLHKTAGTSIERALGPHLKWNDVILGSTKYGVWFQQGYREKFGLYKHSTAQDCYDVVGDNIWNGYFTFATVRNPYSLAVSAFTYARRLLSQEVQDKNYGLGQIAPLFRSGHIQASDLLSSALIKKYIKVVIRRPHEYSRILTWPIVRAFVESGGSFDAFLHTTAAWEDMAMQPQFDRLAICSSGKPSLDLDAVIKLENLGSHWHTVCEQLGFDIPLGKANVSATKPWQDYYRNKQTISLVEERFATDFSQLDYPRLNGKTSAV